ncbi:hypothetical protein [Methylobacterium radiodurans]|uniref:hypothetical protein n=1 Tax=Methylobacterium radiodurans TaxID=2202828 RepID=UPI0013A55A56|nr:hypothetical protein [Methylobacterium radiodurans]
MFAIMADDGTITGVSIKEKIGNLARSIEELAKSLDLKREAGIDPAETESLVATLMQLQSMKELGVDTPDHETIEAIERMTAALKQAATDQRKVRLGRTQDCDVEAD